MSKVLIIFHLWALHYTVFSSPLSPTDVIFSSVNLRNVLQWFPGNGTPGDTHFIVQYAIYGESVVDSRGRRVHWRGVQRCTEIVHSWCDLSNQTRDLEQGYYARVRAVSRRASSRWALTRRFDPKSDTTFGPPLVSLEIENNSAVITLKGPMRYRPNNHTPVVSMATIYPQMLYNLSIYNAHRRKMSHITVASSLYKYRLMEYGTEYCFSARAKFLSMPTECQPSTWHCITTPPDPVIGQLQRVIVAIVVPSVCMCMLVVTAYFLYQYLMGKGQKTPYILSPPSFNQTVLKFPPEKTNLIFMTVIHPSDLDTNISGPSCPKWDGHVADPPPGYAAQRFDVPAEPEQLWDDVSIDYGCVAVAPQIHAGEEETGSRPDKVGDGNHLKGEHQKSTSGDISKRSTHPCPQKQTPVEVRTLKQAQACLQINSAPLTQTQAASCQGTNNSQVEREEEDLGLFLNKTPIESGGMKKQMMMAAGKIDGSVEEGSESERVPLVSACASKTGQSGRLSEDCGVLRPATVDGREKASGEQAEEEHEGEATFIHWNPNSTKLWLPEMVFPKEAGLAWLWQGEKDRRNRVEEEEEGVYTERKKVLLENVFVRQSSEEEAEAKRAMERGGDKGLGLDDIVNKWELVISMDE